MSWKSFFFGLGIGIIVISGVLYWAHEVELREAENKAVISDDEVIERAIDLGMVPLKDLPPTNAVAQVMTDEEVMARAAELGWIPPETDFPLAQEGDEPSQQPSPTPETAATPAAPTITPTSTPEPTPTPSPEPTPTPEPAQEQPPQEQPSQAPSTQPQEPLEPWSTMPTWAVNGDSVTLIIPQGSSSTEICSALEASGLAMDAGTFNRYLIERGYDSQILSGRFVIPLDVGADALSEYLRGIR
ncbi:MAG: hypothetical protein LBU32_18460 [Clostridiales bacterium]|jgi:outer membrane biosynthesis protein TonB|nr:hypothetical protein [Clostridiales bacterium]